MPTKETTTLPSGATLEYEVLENGAGVVANGTTLTWETVAYLHGLLTRPGFDSSPGEATPATAGSLDPEGQPVTE